VGARRRAPTHGKGHGAGGNAAWVHGGRIAAMPLRTMGL
jgi:hypothetical protein